MPASQSISSTSLSVSDVDLIMMSVRNSIPSSPRLLITSSRPLALIIASVSALSDLYIILVKALENVSASLIILVTIPLKCCVSLSVSKKDNRFTTTLFPFTVTSLSARSTSSSSFASAISTISPYNIPLIIY